MSKLDQSGSNTVILIVVGTLVLLLIGAASFGLWAFASRQDFKNNVDQKVAAAVKVAIDQNSSLKDNQFAEQLKQPLRIFKGPDTYGGITIKYPRTWSAYVDETNTDNAPVDGYFYPNFVPGISSNTSFALRVQVATDSYSDELKQFSDNVAGGSVSVSAYRAPKVRSVLGAKVIGQLDTDTQGTMVMFPLRDKTLKIWTESQEFINDFNNYILPNIAFSP